MKPASLIGGGVDGDGLALGIVEAVHRVDVHHPADADEHDDQQQGDHEQTHQDAGRHEAHAVPGIAEDKVILVGGIEGSLQLQGLEAQGVVHVVDGRRVEGEVAAREGERGGGVHAGGAEVALWLKLQDLGTRNPDPSFQFPAPSSSLYASRA